MKAAAWAVLSIVYVVSRGGPAHAQSYENSPHVEGDSATVRVYYDQRVNTTNVKKDVFIYNGPKADEVLAAVRRIVSEQQTQLATLVDKDDVDALRGDLLRQLQYHFDSQPDVIASLKQLLDEHVQHIGTLDIAVGLSYVLAGGPGTGGSGRLGGYLDMLTTGPLRHAFGVHLGFEALGRANPNRDPDGIVLVVSDDRMSYHGWVEPGYEVSWLGKHVSLQFGLLLGAQRLESNSSREAFAITYGSSLGVEARIGHEDGTGVRIGVQYRIASMTRPDLRFHALGPGHTSERNVQHTLVLYAGMYFGLFG